MKTSLPPVAAEKFSYSTYETGALPLAVSSLEESSLFLARDSYFMWQQYLYSGPTGSRPYFVYTPTNYQTGVGVPLVVMLHGCTQTVEDFAFGTQMNQVAEQQNFIVVYPQQVSSANGSLCWNWFDARNQSRGSGEAAIIAGIVQAMQQNTAQWTIDANRIYVAGFSAGAALAVILGATYPDIFAALGVHSGMEYQAAINLNTALRAMRKGGPNPQQQGHVAYTAMDGYARVVPTIVFHGTNDYTTNSLNGDQVVQQWMTTDKLASQGTYNADFVVPDATTTGQIPNGHSYVTLVWNDTDGNTIQHYWKVNGMNHAWSGGKAGGSYTDPLGPDATQAMYLFFMDHSLASTPQVQEQRSLWESVRVFVKDVLNR